MLNSSGILLHFMLESGGQYTRPQANSSTGERPLKMSGQLGALFRPASVLSSEVSRLQLGTPYSVCSPFMTPGRCVDAGGVLWQPDLSQGRVHKATSFAGSLGVKLDTGEQMLLITSYLSLCQNRK